MKKLKKILFLSAVLSLFGVVESKAQLALRTRLVHEGKPFPIPARPSPKHAWVPTEWVEVGPTYKENPGHWEVPPHAGAAWTQGHWYKRHGGYAWAPGHWGK